MPSNEIRTALEMNPSLYRKFAFLVLMNKYNVFGMVHDPMLIQPAVQEIVNLGDMICVSANSQQRLFAKEIARKVQPPYALVRFSPTFSVRDVLKSAASFGSVESHQLFEQSGSAYSANINFVQPPCSGRPSNTTILVSPLSTLYNRRTCTLPHHRCNLCNNYCVPLHQHQHCIADE